MSETDALTLALWSFGVTALITALVSLFLVWTMRGQRDRSSVGWMLKVQFMALSIMSLIKGPLFVYYATRQDGGPEWLPDAVRVWLLLTGSVAAVVLAAIGPMLIAAYIRTVPEPREGSP